MKVFVYRKNHKSTKELIVENVTKIEEDKSKNILMIFSETKGILKFNTKEFKTTIFQN